MATDLNVAALHAAVAHWNAGNLEGYLTLYDPEAVLHGYAGVQPGLSGIRGFYQSFWAAFPGSRLVLEDAFASGNKVASRFLLQGEHRGAFQGIAATGAQINVPGITILEFETAGAFGDGAIRTPLDYSSRSGNSRRGRATRPPS
jgi:SnoaL-like polyketide cyclase